MRWVPREAAYGCSVEPINKYPVTDTFLDYPQYVGDFAAFKSGASGHYCKPSYEGGKHAASNYRSDHPGGCNFLMADSSVAFVNEGIDMAVYRAAARRLPATRPCSKTRSVSLPGLARPILKLFTEARLLVQCYNSDAERRAYGMAPQSFVIVMVSGRRGRLRKGPAAGDRPLQGSLARPAGSGQGPQQRRHADPRALGLQSRQYRCAGGRRDSPARKARPGRPRAKRSASYRSRRLEKIRAAVGSGESGD